MANSSHKRDANARPIPFLTRSRLLKVTAPVAALSTLAVVTLCVAMSSPEVGNVVAKESPAASLGHVSLAESLVPERKEQVSRSSARRAVDVTAAGSSAGYAARVEAADTKKAVAAADEKLWSTADLTLWDGPTDKAKDLGLLQSGEEVLGTGRERNGRTELAIDGKSRWVTSDYLTDEDPTVVEEAETSDEDASRSSGGESRTESGTGGTCSNGSSVPAGVAAGVKKVHQAVCARFPELTSYGTFRGDGEHSQGRAIDIMVSGDRGWQVAEYVRANAGALGVEYVIYAQKIWSVDRSGEGWRSMEDRGSSTANHYDHVHVTVY